MKGPIIILSNGPLLIGVYEALSKTTKKYVGISHTWTSHEASCTNGSSTTSSQIFLIMRTVFGGVRHFKIWLLGSCIVLQNERQQSAYHQPVNATSPSHNHNSTACCIAVPAAPTAIYCTAQTSYTAAIHHSL